MRNRKHEEEQTESLFERKIRQQCNIRQAKNDVLFFGVAVLFALYATQGMFNIQ